MAKTLQFRRGTTSELSTEIGAVGELFVDTTKDTVVVMDGSTLGGIPLATEAMVNSTNSDAFYYASQRQEQLVSGTNIKTVNGTSLLGSGDVNLSTNLTLVGNELRYTNIDGTLQTVDLSPYLDDTTNTISSGILSGNTITFTREDNTTFNVNVSALYDDTNLVTSVNGSTGAVTVQTVLVSGANIKTVNGQSILGSGDISISGSSSVDLSLVSEDILPLFSEVYDLGSTDKRWYDGYFSNTININGAQLTGTSDGVISTTEFVANTAMLGELLISDNLITPNNLSESEYFGNKGTLVVNGNLDIIGDWLNVPVVETTITQVEQDWTLEASWADVSGNGWGGSSVDILADGVLVSNYTLLNGFSGVTQYSIPAGTQQITLDYNYNNANLNENALSGVFTSSQAINQTLNTRPYSGNRIAAGDFSTATITSISNNILGRSGLSKKGNLSSGSLDDGFWSVSMPWQVQFLNNIYSEIFVGTNSYITFGGGSPSYSGLNPSNPPFPKIMISSRDNSAANQGEGGLWTGVEGVFPNRTFRIRFEGNNTAGQGATNIVYEAVFYEADQSRIDVHTAQNANWVTDNNLVVEDRLTSLRVVETGELLSNADTVLYFSDPFVVDTSNISVTNTVAEYPPVTGLEGFIRYNKDVASFEGHDGTEWATLGNAVSYTPATASDWNGTPPTTIVEALDRLATLVKNLNSGNGA